MRFTVERKVMVSALKNISVCVGRSTLPILYNVVIEAKDGKITMTCSNLHIEFTVCVAPIEIFEEGITSVNAKKLLSILESISMNGIEMESHTETYHLHINAGKAEFLLLGLNPTGFPHIESEGDTERIEEIDTELLYKIFSTNKFACSRESNRPALQGINVIFERNQISAFASDGKVLSCMECNIERDKDDSYNVIYTPDLYTMFTPNIYLGAKIKIFNYKNCVVIKGDSASITSKIIDLNYPNVKGVIPNTDDFKTYIVDSKIFDEKCKLSTVFSTESNKTLSIKFVNHATEFLTTTEQNGTYKDSVENDIDIPEGEEVELRFTVNYLSNIIHGALNDSDKLNIMFKSGTVPIVFYDNSCAGTLKKIILMPLRPKKTE